jgi:hypothetical protein
MPVVIKELVINATVDSQALQPSGSPADLRDTLAAVRTQQQLVQDCVAQVLAVLHEQAER